MLNARIATEYDQGKQNTPKVNAHAPRASLRAVQRCGEVDGQCLVCADLLLYLLANTGRKKERRADRIDDKRHHAQYKSNPSHDPVVPGERVYPQSSEYW